MRYTRSLTRRRPEGLTRKVRKMMRRSLPLILCGHCERGLNVDTCALGHVVMGGRSNEHTSRLSVRGGVRRTHHVGVLAREERTVFVQVAKVVEPLLRLVAGQQRCKLLGGALVALPARSEAERERNVAGDLDSVEQARLDQAWELSPDQPIRAFRPARNVIDVALHSPARQFRKRRVEDQSAEVGVREALRRPVVGRG